MFIKFRALRGDQIWDRVVQAWSLSAVVATAAWQNRVRLGRALQRWFGWGVVLTGTLFLEMTYARMVFGFDGLNAIVAAVLLATAVLPTYQVGRKFWQVMFDLYAAIDETGEMVLDRLLPIGAVNQGAFAHGDAEANTLEAVEAEEVFH